MVSAKVREICRDIKALKIQGARNIAKSAVRALSVQAKESRAKDADEFLAELIEAADALASTRPTEPMLRNSLNNAIRFVFTEITKKKATRDVKTLKKLVEAQEKTYQENVEKGAKNIAEYGAKEIPRGACVLTHCHSSTAINVIKRAHEMGKEIEVICTETRPKFQGRVTAKELRDAGLKVTMIVDSAVRSFAKEVDCIIVGADAINARGDLVNKIGTAGIAQIAHALDIPFYSAAELYKFNPLTLWGKVEVIEERAPDEVADPKEFKGIKIRNPAFDVTDSKYITAFITEAGVIPPASMLNLLMEEFDIKTSLTKKEKRR
ncbi:MAG: ribose 1,5-bisphosphate isomerase [Candidatus Micrarchaeota archaeon]